MGRFVLRRLAAALLLLWMVLTGTFLLLHVAPGDPAALFEGPRMSRETKENILRHYGLHLPLHEQYLRWLGSALKGDWGTSITHQRAAAAVLLEKLPNTFLLAFAAIFVEYSLGIALGMTAAARAGRAADHQLRLLSLFFFSMPPFWLALLAIELFAVRWSLLPVSQMRSVGAEYLPFVERQLDVLRHLVLPALTVGLARCGGVMRFVRNGLLEVLDQDYIRTALSIGLHPRRVLLIHALKNTLGPLVQRFGIALPGLLSGSIVIEVIFAWPGLGTAAYSAVLERDYPVVLASTALTGAMVVMATFLTDLAHAWIDPRVRDRIN